MLRVSSRQDIGRPRTVEDLLMRYDFDAIVGLKQASKNSEVGLNKTNKTLEEFMIATLGSIEDLQSQLDGNITTWFFSGVPSLENQPANEWTTNEMRDSHLGDLYYDQDTGYAYRFVYNEGQYKWLELADNDVAEALALANAAQDTADSKRRVFVTRPEPPYDIGDLWFFDKEIYICQKDKETGVYEEGDFIIATNYTDDINGVKKDLATNYYTTVEVDSAIWLSKDGILSTVSKTYVTTSAYDGLVKTVETVETKANQTAEQFEWIVNKGGTATTFTITDRMIAATTERFEIKSDSGSTIISGGKINVDELFAQNINATGTITGIKLVGATGSFSGKIEAGSGTIGGASIDGYGMYFNNGNVGWGLWGTTAHDNIAIHAGANSQNIGGAPFRVYHNGYAHIGGFDIDNNSLISGSWGETGGVMICTGTATAKSIGGSPSNTNGWCFAAGNGFGVTKDGSMYCKNGSIGGWEIGNKSLSAKTTQYYSMELFSEGRSFTGNTGVFFLVMYEHGVPVGGITSSGWRTISA